MKTLRSNMLNTYYYKNTIRALSAPHFWGALLLLRNEERYYLVAQIEMTVWLFFISFDQYIITYICVIDNQGRIDL